MAALKDGGVSQRAERALARAARDRHAQVAAGLVAGAGAAIAATKLALERHENGGAEPVENRTYRLRRKEPAPDGIRRVARGRADGALEQLRGGAKGDLNPAVHEARKDLKKLRSVLRLVRDDLGDAVYRSENVRFRDAGRMLSGARDAQVKLETLAALRERFEDRLSADGMALFVHALDGERERLADPRGDELALDRAAGAIEAGRDAIAEWPLHEDEWPLIGPGLKRSYRRGRNRFRDVRAEASDEAVHEWRKRVKDLWYHLRLVRNAKKSVLGEAADEAHELSDLLGDHHDLAVLRDDAVERRELFVDGDLEQLLVSISERQEELTANAISLGERLYARKPKAFERRLRSYWESWR
jgi:CHAD domain-containing protein